MFAVLSGRPMMYRRCLLQVVALEDRTVPTAGYFRIAEYNVLAAGGSPNAGLDTLMQGFSNEHLPVSALPSTGVQEQLDIIAMQEVQSQATTSQAVVNLLNGLYGAGTYARGTLNGGSTGSGTQGIVYNQLKLHLDSEAAIGGSSTTGQPRQALRYKFHPIGYSAVNDFYIYNSHYKAGNQSGSPSDEERREPEATAIRADADALGNGANIIYLGDFNVYTSSEVFFQHLLSAGNGQAFDPVNQLGSWSNNATFKTWFTQAPLLNAPSGFTGGGLDDRFDMQLITAELKDGIGLDYVPNTYHTFGNNGSVLLNGNINDASNTALPDLANRTTLLNLLTTVSDHLPVVADYRIIVPPTITGTQINDGSAQRSMITSLKVTFNQAVTLPGNPATAFTLVRQGGGTVNLSGTVVGNSVTLNFTGGAVDFASLADGRYTLTAVASLINGGNFDGNGDGTPGDNYVFASAASPSPATNIFRIFGDSDGDGNVAASDFIQFRLAFGGTSTIFDFDGDGSVSANDFVQFRLRFGASI